MYTTLIILAACTLVLVAGLIVREVRLSSRARKHAAVPPESGAGTTRRSGTEVRPRLPNLLVEPEDDDEGREQSKPMTVFEDDALRGLEEPTGVKELFAISAVGQSDIGRRRPRNEDSYLVLEQHSLVVVADGMGGYAGGEVASRIAVETIATCFDKGAFEGSPDPSRPPRGNELVWAIEAANAAIHETAKSNDEYTGMGTTVVAARFSPRRQRVFIGHVGDSRCYRMRDGKFKQLTTDHTLRARGMTGPMANRVRRALGTRSRVAVDLVVDKPEASDVYLVCSDGLSSLVSDERVKEILDSERDLKRAANRLIDAANDSGGRDNVTVVLVSIQEAGSRATMVEA